jgi:predicted small lipoprotein YifL
MKMNRVSQTVLHLVMALGVCVSLAGCHKEGPLEKAGRNVDEATTNVGNKIEDKCEQAKDAAGAKDTRC